MSQKLFIALVLLLPAASSGLVGQTLDETDRLRSRMVSEFIEKEGIRNRRVLAAMRTVPRHEFMPPELAPNAYVDAAWAIGFEQTISPPFVVAFMTDAIDPQPSDRVLEVGTGSGYQAAVLSLLVKEVYSIEIVKPLHRLATSRLAHLGYRNVKTKLGDGYLGWPQAAPFDKIIVTCSPENVPKPLIEQLKEGGRMVIPLGASYQQDIYLLEKREGKLIRKALIPTLFVPMTGRAERERTAKPDPLHPYINNGGFECCDSDGQPSGWYYQRQLTVGQNGAREGRRFAQFTNADPGRTAQALQGMAIDGRRIVFLTFTLNVRAQSIVDGREPQQKAGLQVRYYDANRQPVGDVVGPPSWRGSFDWQHVTTTLPVPLDAHDAIICVGLNGATGQLQVDDVKVTARQR